MLEHVGNLHVHSTLSDGHGTHAEIVQAAFHAGLDFVVITDHNLRPDGLDGYRYQGEKRVLLLIGEEVHDQARTPEKSHLLVYETRRTMAEFASATQTLINEINRASGLSFLAHPYDCAAPRFGQPDLSWDDWGVEGFTGLELWNFMVEFKCRLKNWPRALYYSFLPQRISRGPKPETLARWNALLSAGRRVVVIGNSDAHALPAKLGPLRRVLFPYQWLFRAVNTHVFTERPLVGDPELDRASLFEAIRGGRCFVGYDRDVSSRGFTFSGHSEEGSAVTGDRLGFRLGATLQVHSPAPGQIRILRAGSLVREWPLAQSVVLTVSQPGPYRVEVHLPVSGSFRPWIYSNPIYIEQA